jgi:hypothetical protein
MIGSSITAPAQPAEFAFTPTNSSGTFYGQATVNGVPANANDWVAAFDLAGNCAGAAQVIMNDGLAYINLPIYGDDMTTSTVDEGITASEPFTLNLWRAGSGTVLNYPALDAIVLFENWSNTNGAPMPGYDNPEVVYNFEETAQPPSISGPEATCVDAEPFEFATAPAGGVLVGPGVAGTLFYPAAAGEGTHLIEYIVDNVIASWTIEVLPAFDATILTTGPFCANDPPAELEAAMSGGTWTGNGVFGTVFDPAFVTPGTVNLTYELGEPGNACYDLDQQAVIVFPAPSEPVVQLIQPLLDGTFHVVVMDQAGVTFEWFDPLGELIATGDTLFNYEETAFEVVGTNTYGCTASLATTLIFPGVFDLREVATTWLSPTTVEVVQGVERAQLWDLQGRLLWSRTMAGATRVELPLHAGDGWRLVTLELRGGGTARTAVVR